MVLELVVNGGRGLFFGGGGGGEEYIFFSVHSSSSWVRTLTAYVGLLLFSIPSNQLSV